MPTYKSAYGTETVDVYPKNVEAYEAAGWQPVEVESTPTRRAKSAPRKSAAKPKAKPVAQPDPTPDPTPETPSE